MKFLPYFLLSLILYTAPVHIARCQNSPDKINFIRQATQRLIFDENQSIPLASLDSDKIIGFYAQYPVTHYSEQHSDIQIQEGKLVLQSLHETKTGIWFGGFNPFATYTIDMDSCSGNGEVGFKFSDAGDKQQFFVKVGFHNSRLTGVSLHVIRNSKTVVEKSVAVNAGEVQRVKGQIILQMLGSGFTLYLQDEHLPNVIGQCDFNTYLDLRKKEHINSFRSQLFVKVKEGQVRVNDVKMALTTGVGLADIRAITYENGEPMLDRGRLWYTMSVRGRALPHHIQGVFSLNPTVFDLKFEGIILFDRNDGLLRNEIASHIFYDRNQNIWRGLTTGFSAFANPDKEKKQLLAVESTADPRFGFSVMKAEPSGIVGDIEDPHVFFDSEANKWRILTCENHNGYKAVILESDYWDKGYERIAGPVDHNSTGTSIQKIAGKYYCFSGSSDRKIYIYTYPDLDEAGTLMMDLPPWDEKSGTRVWPNVVELPDGYPFRYVALMMDRYNYPGLKGPNWSYGALYLYHGFFPFSE